jgi:hypothetical protein
MRGRRLRRQRRAQVELVAHWVRLASSWRGAAFWMVWLPILLLPGAGSHAEAGRTSRDARAATAHGQKVADQFREALGIVEAVEVSTVSRNPLLVSVARSPERPGTFLLTIEEAFLAMLDEEELRAVIAHELGHVWIFTNHPYLQTEQLANRIAMRLVSRDSLARVYPKVWERMGTKGDIERFLGQ